MRFYQVYILSVAPIFGISRSKVKLLESGFILLTKSILLSVTTGLLLLVLVSSLEIAHPVLIVGSLIISRALTGIILGKILHFWILVSLLLIFLGGMIVIFTYLTTLARRDKLVVPSLPPKITLLFFLIAVIPSKLSPLILPQNISLSSLYSPVSNTTLFLVTAYLLLGLLAIVKLSEAHKGAISKW